MNDQSPPRSFRIQGMDCAEEVTVLKREVGPVAGGEENLSFDVLNAKMTVAAGRPAMRAYPSAAPVTTPSNSPSTHRMPGMRSSAATKCISDVPGLAKHVSTPLASNVWTRDSAPFIRFSRWPGLARECAAMDSEATWPATRSGTRLIWP